MNVQYDVPIGSSIAPWALQVDGTKHDEMLTLDHKQDGHIKGIARINAEEFVLLQKVFPSLNPYVDDFGERTFQASIKSSVDARFAVDLLRVHHGILICNDEAAPYRMKWDYAIIVLGPTETLPPVQTFKGLGKDGWELVAVDGAVAYFKRFYA